MNPLQIGAHGKQFDGIVHRHEGAAILELEPNPGPPIAMRHPFRAALLRIQRVVTSAELADVVVQQMRRVTGFERVMFYRFHEDGHGSVDGEAKEPALEPYLGLALSGLRHSCPGARAVSQELASAHLRCQREASARRSDPARGHGRSAGPQLFGSAQCLAHSPPVHGQHGSPRFHEHLAHRSRPPVGTHQLPEPHQPVARFAGDADGV